MLIAFQVLLLIIIFVTFIGVMYTKSSVILQGKLTGMFYMSLLSFVVSVIWL